MKAEGVQILTYPDIMEYVTNDLVNSSDDAAASAFSAMLTQRGDIALMDRVFTLMAHARGFHARAEMKRQQGNHSGADFLHSVGQHLLELAALEHSQLMATLVDAFEVKH